MKTCFKCSVCKPLSEFYEHKAMSDGRLNKCKTCAKQDASRHRARNLDAARDYDRARAKQPHRIALRNRVSKEWAREHPLRRAAQVAVGNAIRDARLVKWPVCAVPDCAKNSEAHHPDYDQPLSVVWLCRAHHKQAHALTPDLTIALLNKAP